MRKNPCTDESDDESPICEAERSSRQSDRNVEGPSSGIKRGKIKNIRRVFGNANELLSTDENIPDEQNKNESQRKDKNNNVFIIILNGESTCHNHCSSSEKGSKKILDLSSAFMNDNLTQDNILVENVNLSLRKIKNIQNDVSNIISFTNRNNEKTQQQNAEIGPKCFLVLNCSVASDKCDLAPNKCYTESNSFDSNLNRSSSFKQYNNRHALNLTTDSVGKSKSNMQTQTEKVTKENLIQVKQEEGDSFILVVKDDNDNRDNALKPSDKASLTSEEGGTDARQASDNSEEEYESRIDMFMIKRKYEKQQRTVIVKHEGDVKYYACDKCDKRYTNLKSLKTHHYTRCFINRNRRITEGVKMLRKRKLKRVGEGKFNDSGAPETDPRRSFSCRKCGDCFEDKLTYRNHIRYRCKVPRAVPFICEFCGKEFRYRSTFWSHKKAHKNLREYVCQECGKGYNTSRILSNHIKRVHMGQQCLYFCAHCGIKSKSKSHIEAHEKIHFLSKGEKIEKPFHCECGESFISQHELSNHNYVYHVNKKCPHCSERFLSISNLKQHKKEVHTKEGTARRDTSQQCPLCQKVYASIISFKQHLQNIHGLDRPNVARRLECDVCHKTYTSFAYYINHKREVHNEEVSAEEIEAFKEIIVPPWEQEAFEEKRKAREERRTRRRERRSPEARGRPPGRKGPKRFEGTEHACDICGKTYTKRHLMKSHMIRVHSARGAYCELCRTEFINKGQYYRHRYEVHVCAEEERTCGVCGKVFDKIRSLWAHRIVHDGSVAFGCPECESRFKRKGDLTRHLRDKHDVVAADNASRRGDLAGETAANEDGALV